MNEFDDEYYLYYKMMIAALSTNDVKKGMNISLYLLGQYLSSDNIVIYTKNDQGNFIQKMNDKPLNGLGHPISCIVNKTANLVENKSIYDLELNLTSKIKNMMLINLNVDDYECIMSIINYDKSKNLQSIFWNNLQETMNIIIKRAISYEKNTKAITTDLLTGVDNRNSYELRLQKLDESNKHLVFGLFDLFRLKYVNDNFGHAIGDIYIKETAKILAKYWPKENVILNEDGTEKAILTGHTIYRIGGDEFVLITDHENIELTKIKANLAADEVNTIKLPVEKEVKLGLNKGIVHHKTNDFIKNTYNKADKILNLDKNNMYTNSGIERRR